MPTRNVNDMHETWKQGLPIIGVALLFMAAGLGAVLWLQHCRLPTLPDVPTRTPSLTPTITQTPTPEPTYTNTSLPTVTQQATATWHTASPTLSSVPTKTATAVHTATTTPTPTIQLEAGCLHYNRSERWCGQD